MVSALSPSLSNLGFGPSLKGELVRVLFGRRGTAPQNELVSLTGCSACDKIPNREN